ncbi:L-Ala-D/L-Glu epimerase [Azospirillaceae bacterium]
MSRPILTIRRERFPIRGLFRISRGARTEAEVVVAEIKSGPHIGRGEAVPYARYGETVESVIAALQAQTQAIANELDRIALQAAMPPGAARNALDCALWDLEAKHSEQPAWKLAGLRQPPVPLTTAYTLSLDAPSAMAEAAREVAYRPLLKIKLTGEGDLERVQAVRNAAPQSRLIVDANEAWSINQLQQFAPSFAALGVALIEQPLPAANDEALKGFSSPIPLCADESCHDRKGLESLKSRYSVVNIKLDKTGGLTEALALKAAAQKAGLQIMVGCMVASSLAMAPAVLVGQNIEFVDLDGPLLLAQDREPKLRYEQSLVYPPTPELWG